MLGHGIKLKSIRILEESQRQSGISGKNNNAPQNIRVYLTRLWSDGFQPYNVITLSSSFLQLFTVTMAHTEKYSTRFTSPFTLGYKQNEHGNIM